MECKMEFSPPKPVPEVSLQESKCFDMKDPISLEMEEKPILILKPFSPIPHISFDKVKLGNVKSCELYIKNPLNVVQYVSVQKLPSDKGFSIKEEFFSVEPGEEKSITVIWAPVKSISCRETVMFKSSTGFKTQAYLLGTAFSPRKMGQRVIVSKKSRQRKKSSQICKQKIVEDIKHSKNKTDEGKKENLDFTNLKSESFVNFSESFNLKILTESSTSFNHNGGCEFPDSPIRRQTYTINSMLQHGRPSEILPFQLKESPSDINIKNSFRKYQTYSTLNRQTFHFPTSLSRNSANLCHPTTHIIQHEDNLNDSLENKSLNDSIELKFKNLDFEITNEKDSVDMYNVASKQTYFDITSKQTSINNSDFINTIEHLNTNLKESMLSAYDKDFNFSANYSIPNNFNWASFDNQNFNDLDTFKQPYGIISKAPVNFSKIPYDNITYKSCTSPNKIFHNSLRTDLSTKLVEFDDNMGEKSAKSRNVMEEIKPNCFVVTEKNVEQLNNHCNLNEIAIPEGVSTECEVNSSLVKRSKNSLFMEIPYDNSVSTKSLSHDLKKHAKVSVSSKNSEKKVQKSCFKGKGSKGFAAKRESNKNSSMLHKSKEKAFKFIPQKLYLTKPKLSESVVYHRNPFASMNTYYDEHWVEKQESAFTAWLNFILTPNDFNSEDVKVDAAKLWIESIKETTSVSAPTKEELSLKAYTAIRNLNLLRKSSYNLYQTESIVAVIKKIEKEVDLKKISIRKDRAIHADLGIKKDILEMLLSYNTLWLRIGLETVYGEVINLNSNSDVIGLSRFIFHRFLQNPEISTKYLHSAVINYYKKGYDDEIKRFTLKKFLLLVFYLDTAKNCHLIKHNPCLFNKNSKYKSSRELLLAFSREYLGGEGDVTKHLRYLGYKVSYQQSAIEEFDYSVRNISTDLRCGLRLGRVVELILEDWTISSMLRVNTLNRLTKIHNNDVILKALKNAIEIENEIEAKHLTDGHREKTLDLLWQIIFKTQITKLINKNLLKKENEFLLRSLKLKADVAAYNALRNYNTTFNSQEINIQNSKLYKENEILQLLFQWCFNVCAHYGVKVHNFTSSFSDGRVLCLLLHHYHPNVLPYESIKMKTSISYFEEQMEIDEISDNCPFYMQDGQTNLLMENLLKNERDNLTLVFKKFQDVGHIPILSCPSKISNTLPDEKVTITLVSYINIRLMELSIEIRAARIILHAWRQYMLRKQHKKLKVEIMAVIKIQKAWRNYLIKKNLKQENISAIVIQKYWRMYVAKKQLANLQYQKILDCRTKNAIIIQAYFRGYSTRKNLLKCHKAAIAIQSSFRKYYARSNFLKLKKVCMKIQQNFRARTIGRSQRLIYIKLREDTLLLQAFIRGLLFRRNKVTQHLTAIKIQSYIRMWLLKRKYNKIKNACITIQQRYRDYLLKEFYQQEYKKQRCAAIIIQRWYRAIKTYQHDVQCVIKVQSFVRRYLARKKYLNLSQKVIAIQQWWKAILIGRKTRLTYLKHYRSIVCIQSFFRQCAASRKYRKQKQSALIIQKFVRRFFVRRRFCELRKNVILIQNMWRAKLIVRKIQAECLLKRKKVEIQAVTKIQKAWKKYWLIKNAIIIQAAYRGYFTRKFLLKRHRAAVVIQSFIRRYHIRSNFLKLKEICIKIQQNYHAKVIGRHQRLVYLSIQNKTVLLQSYSRGMLLRKDLNKQHLSAIKIQACIRMWLLKKKYKKKKSACIIIQQRFRNYLIKEFYQQEYKKQRCAAIIIQRWYRAVKTYQHDVQCVIKVQSFVRRYLTRKKYLNLSQKVITVQQWWRAVLIGRKTRLTYLKHYRSIVCIQSFFRQCAASRKYRKQKQSALIVQKYVRKFFARRRFCKLRKNVILIQNIWRAKLIVRKARSEYLARRRKIETQAVKKIQKSWRKYWLKRNAIMIQAAYRGYSTRKFLLKRHRAAVVIQSFIRRYHIRSNFLKLKEICIKIQQNYHAKVIGRHQRLVYLSIQNKTVLLQSYSRGMLLRKDLNKQHLSAIKIQACIRMWLLKKKYKKKKSACIIIQQRFRNYLIKEFYQQEYKKQRCAAIIIQRWYRAVKTYQHDVQCVIKVQSFVRRYLTRKKYLNLSQKVITVQQWWRAVLIGRKTRLTYLKHYRSIVCIQSFFRQCAASRKYRKQKQSALIVQKYVRKFFARRRFCKLRKNVILIQNIWRAKLIVRKARSEYLAIRRKIETQAVKKIQKSWRKYWLKRNAIMIQAAYRGYSTRKFLLKRHRAAIVIQSFIRRYRIRSNFLKLKEICIKIQQNYHAKVIGRHQRLVYLNIQNKTVLLQSYSRGMLLRKDLKKQHLSAIKIQACIRMWLLKKKYNKKKSACITIQQRFRNYLLKEFYQQEYKKQRCAAIIIQRWYRALKTYQHDVQCVIKAQSFVRRYLTRKKYLNLSQKVVTIQQWWRAVLIGRKTRLTYLKHYRSIVCIQSFFRQCAASRKYRKQKQSALIVQKYIRRFFARRRFCNLKKNVIFVQNIWRAKLIVRKAQSEYLARRKKAAYRGFVTRRYLSKQHHAAVVIQTSFRRYHARSHFLKLKEISIRIQQNYHARVSGRYQRLIYLNIQSKTVLLQSYCRGILLKRDLKKQHLFAIKIQACVRMWLLKKKYNKLKNACITIQQRYKDYLLKEFYQQEYKKQRCAAITIQRWYRAVKTYQHYVQCVIKVQSFIRRYLARKKYLNLSQKVITIQQWWRAIVIGRKTRLMYLKHYRSIVCIQSFFRQYAASRKYRKQKQSALIVQKYVRRFFVRRRFCELRKNVILIQNIWRAKLMLKKAYFEYVSDRNKPLPIALKEHFWYVSLKKSIIQFQRAARIYNYKQLKALITIQSAFRMWSAKEHFKQLKAAIKIQAFWRAYIVRCSITDRRILEARKRIFAADSTESKKLKNRTTRSLQLLQDTSIQNIITALQELDICTQLSPKCCERLVESGGVSNLIYLVWACNRSVPHMTLIKYIANILLNIAKYEKTVDYIWEKEKTLETVLHLMKIFREKGPDIFSKCCSLLWIFSQDQNKVQIMTRNNEFTEKIRSYHYLLTRKQSLEAKRLVDKTIAARSFNTSIFQKSMTNVSIRHGRSQRSSLNIDPDWLLGRHRHREFKDPVVAITWLMKILNLKNK